MAKTIRDPRDVILEPVVTEKSYAAMEAGKYTFVVNPEATKTEIRQAVEQIFGVRVLDVNTIKRPGKRRRVPGTWRYGKTSARKHAVVTLYPGEKIELFEG